jgi:hypothetical protein
MAGRWAFVALTTMSLFGASCETPPSGGGDEVESVRSIPFGLQRGTGFKGLPKAVAADAWHEAIRARGGGSPPALPFELLPDRLVRDRIHSANQVASPSQGQIETQQSELIQGAVWFPIGPAPVANGQAWPGRTSVSGRANSIAVNPMNPDDIWLGTATGGVWHSVNLTNTQWQPRSDSEESLAIGVVKLDGCSASGCSSIWVGTGENSIRRDTYYGAGLMLGQTSGGEFPSFNWTPRGRDVFKYGNIVSLIVDTANPTLPRPLYVALSSGLTSPSTEGATTAPTPPNGFGLYKSIDNGTSWNKLTVNGSGTAKPTDLEIDPQDHNVLYAGFRNTGMFKSTDAGMTWNPINTGIDPAVLTASDWPEIAVSHDSATSPAILYAVLGACRPPFQYTPPFDCFPGFFRSSDAGASWTQRTAPGGGGGPHGYTMYTHALKVLPGSPDTLYYGGFSVFKSTDGAMTFTVLGEPSMHPDLHDIALFPGTQNLYAVSDGGFFTSTNDGATWVPRNDGLQSIQFQSISVSPLTSAVIGGTQDNGTEMFTGSKAWDHIDDGDSASTIMDLDDVNLMYDVYVGLEPRKCSSFGNCAFSFGDVTNGLAIADPVGWYPPIAQDPLAFPGMATQHALYFVTNKVYRSTNDAATWGAVSPVLAANTFFPEINQNNVITAISARGGRAYIGFYNGEIFTTTNLTTATPPATWSPIGGSAKGLPNRVVTSFAIDPGNDQIAYVTFSGFGTLSGDPGSHVFKTTNAGATWTSINGALPNLPVNAIAIENGPPQTLWLATDVGVYKRLAADGNDWARFGTGLPNVSVNALAIDEARGRIYAGTHGRGAWVITSPYAATMEGWVNNTIWDIPVYGHGFISNATCTLTLIRQDGSICSTGGTDAQGATIGTDADGNLVSSRGSVYSGKQVVWGCYNGTCLNGSLIDDCNQPGNRISTVRVHCTGFMSAQDGVAQINGCPSISNPPSTALVLEGNPSPGHPAAPAPLAPPPAAGAPGAPGFAVMAALQAGDGTSRVLCSATMNLPANATDVMLVDQAVAAVNSSPSCATAQVTAARVGTPIPIGDHQEDFPANHPALQFSAPKATGTQIFTAVSASPGATNRQCFSTQQIGVPMIGSLVLPRLAFRVGPSGAGGGSITITEASAIGQCELSIPTVAGQSAANIAANVVSAFLANTATNTCTAAENPRDVIQDGDSNIFVMSRSVRLCIADDGVGVSVGPEELGPLCVPPQFTFVPPAITIRSCMNPNIGQATATGCSVVVTDNAPAKFPLGTTVVTWTARDAVGNVITATQTVTAELGDDPSCCPAGTNVILGTSNNDNITGTSGSDCILARGGQDIVNGGSGNDFISGGDGDDVLNGQDGNDTIYGGSGQDTINGGNDNDTLFGGDGDDTIHGGSGDDVISGGQGQDRLFGDDGNDNLFGDDGDDTLNGGNGNDHLDGGGLHDTCIGGPGTNTFVNCQIIQ